MGVFATRSRGVVVRIKGPGRASNFRIAVATSGTAAAAPNLTFPAAIAMQAQVAMQENAQFLHTLDDAIFVYAFGDRISSLTISGAAFAEECVSGKDGMSQIITYYRKNRLSARDTPLIIVYGGITFRGFLVGCNMDVANAETQLGQWTLGFNAVPVGI